MSCRDVDLKVGGKISLFDRMGFGAQHADSECFSEFLSPIGALTSPLSLNNSLGVGSFTDFTGLLD